MPQTLTLVDIFKDATVPVLLVLALLLLASLFSWTLIVRKHRQLKQAEQGCLQFEQNFWSGATMSETYLTLVKNTEQDEMHSPSATVFRAGYEEAKRQKDLGHTQYDEMVNAMQRGIRAAWTREAAALEQGLSQLATVGSVSPYVGLLGTVWGIMHAFIGLAGTQQASLGQVAPGIAEALIATAVGLIAAIPAVVAYNAFTTRIERLENRIDAFGDELINILSRSLPAAKTAEPPPLS